jgi:hypothetical protein
MRVLLFRHIAASVFFVFLSLTLYGCSDDDSPVIADNAGGETETPGEGDSQDPADPGEGDSDESVGGDSGDPVDGDTNDPGNDGSENPGDGDSGNPGDDDPVVVSGVNFNNFLAGSIAGDVTEIDCTLTDGSVSRCYQFEVIGEPMDHGAGPYCPRTIDDGPELTGKWMDNGELVDLTGEYVANLSQRYGEGWLLHDPNTGLVNVTDTPESCLAAAQLNPPEQWWNYCIECTIDGVGGPVPLQITIPIVPVPRQVIAELGNTFPGVSLNGIGLSFPADIDGILATFNIAALDDCGGHVNNAISYHYHGAAGCSHEIAQPDNHGAMIGYAMDGYAIYAMTDLDGVEPDDLDECRGHTDQLRGYHYHAASPGENMFIGCFSGEVAVVEGGGGGGQGPGDRPPRP